MGQQSDKMNKVNFKHFSFAHARYLEHAEKLFLLISNASAVLFVHFWTCLHRYEVMKESGCCCYKYVTQHNIRMMTTAKENKKKFLFCFFRPTQKEAFPLFFLAPLLVIRSRSHNFGPGKNVRAGPELKPSWALPLHCHFLDQYIWLWFLNITASSKAHAPKTIE